ncbi:37088_t:CDS:2 [Gigaspora margarita]|uniref:37088_t:CDS:1 n=1 Tax=Gigaspora margarita TaxID=4874 RepID=A0ABN7U9I1_GIGMA|nr:37088_t:CDS:2 [Gigaspora margarita]
MSLFSKTTNIATTYQQRQQKTLERVTDGKVSTNVLVKPNFVST